MTSSSESVGRTKQYSPQALWFGSPWIVDQHQNAERPRGRSEGISRLREAHLFSENQSAHTLPPIAPMSSELYIMLPGMKQRTDGRPSSW
jgi:hypothetical protein